MSKMNVTVKKVPQAEIVKIEKENKPIVKAANALVIKNVDHENEAYEVLKTIKKQKKIIETKRKSITQPLNASLKEVNAMFKTLTGPLDEADKVIRGKVLTFHEKREAQAEARRQRAMEKAEAEEDEEVAEELMEKAEDITANVGESQTTKRWTFDVVNVSEIPTQYLIPDNVAIRRAITEGVREIPGLRIFQKEGLRVV
jgi:hypothetical protein